jgi:DNA repair protein RAD57
MTALAAQIPSLTTRPGGTLILTSEREISTDRLYGLGEYMLAVHEPQGRLTPSDLLDHILSHSVENITLLEHALNYKLPHILRARNGPSQKEHPVIGAAGKVGLLIKPIRLLIIDSITALIRGAEGNYANSTSMGLTERSRHLCAVADRLKHLALEFGLAVLVINQVSDVFTRPPVQSSTPTGPLSSQMLSQFYTDGPEPPMLYATQSRWFSGQTATLQKEASLGIVWANAVNVRVMLSQTKRRRTLGVQDLKRKRKKPNGTHASAEPDEEPGRPDPVVDDTIHTLIRRAQVVFSPFVPPATVDFVITETGIHALPDSYRLVDVAETARRRGRIARALLLENGDEEDSLPSRSSQMIPDTQAIPERADDDVPFNGERDAVDTYDFDDYDELGPIPDDLWDSMGSGSRGIGGAENAE